MKDKKVLHTIIPKRVFRLFGCRRSGNHAIISWITKQVDGTYYFRNNKNKKEPFFQTVLGKKRTTENRKLVVDNFICNYENKRIEECVEFEFSEYYDVIVCRDILNMVASQIKTNRVNDIDFMISLWKYYTSLDEHERRIIVNFNEWHINEQYRRTISKQLKLNFNDEGKNIVSSIGGGSSFDGVDYNGKAHEMDLLNRWKQYHDHEYIKRILNDDELLTLLDEKFNMSDI